MCIVQVMKDIFAAVDKYKFSGEVFVIGEVYQNFITTDILTGKQINNVIISSFISKDNTVNCNTVLSLVISLLSIRPRRMS